MTVIETKVLDLSDMSEELQAEVQSLRRIFQDNLVVKITWDARDVAKDRYQVELMLLIIPEGEEGRHYCQSCLRIRTAMVISGKDSQENLQANFPEALEQLGEIVRNGLRFSARYNTFLGQVGRMPPSPPTLQPCLGLRPPPSNRA